MKQRIQKILSAHGVASRREAEKMIAQGRVTVNGAAAKTGDGADADTDEILVDGVLLQPKSKPLYIMLNKPRGYVTTMKDEQGRKTVTQLVCDLDERVYPVGRLDINTEGLLLMTNDGDFANAVMHPSFCVHKTYEVHVRGDIESAAQALRLPMTIDGHALRAVCVSIQKRAQGGGILSITISEGRNRQIRKMCAQNSIDVLSLKRVSVGPLKLGSLPAGKWRHLTRDEIIMIRK